MPRRISARKRRTSAPYRGYAMPMIPPSDGAPVSEQPVLVISRDGARPARQRVRGGPPERPALGWRSAARGAVRLPPERVASGCVEAMVASSSGLVVGAWMPPRAALWTLRALGVERSRSSAWTSARSPRRRTARGRCWRPPAECSRLRRRSPNRPSRRPRAGTRSWTQADAATAASAWTSASSGSTHGGRARRRRGAGQLQGRLPGVRADLPPRCHHVPRLCRRPGHRRRRAAAAGRPAPVPPRPGRRTTWTT